MRQIEAKFSFFKAGQGSFYGGRICQHDTGKVFTIVYDCGTTRFIKGNNQSLNNEIDIFKYPPHYFPHNNEIDLLFISHLDYDHVSGLKRLLKEFNVKNIILPYIEKKDRQFFLVSVSGDDNPDNSLSIVDYISFIESPDQFILQNSESKEVKIFFVKSNGKTNIEYKDYDNENQSESIYPRGTPAENEEYTNQRSVSVYENNLQFFIEKYWEFTTYAKSVNQKAITKLHDCLRKTLNKNSSKDLTFEDLKEIVTDNRKEAHDCYTNCIGDINSHGLILLHGPIRFEHLCGRVYSSCEFNHASNDFNHRHFHDDYHFRKRNLNMLGTLLFGDSSINPNNNPIDFPMAFKDKLVNVHIVQVPHHGSSENWDFDAFKNLKIGDSFSRWDNQVIAVCNFGYGNTYGHPSHKVLNDLRSTIFMNTQFSRLNIKYSIIHYRP
ncbi:MBL fold metallo-hydrolase [Labilibaculum sp. DW002]|uniref:MBL fold metallo-hydrolase n=1 Tax=Paralabilibaculum antarcticum TaxID=2912572 RepID=A0ABT5VT32_9BACT|nr:MBL fold metallo-hydrolase [Labilibaculum sp. DW002]MDE5418457.1 MBL fold metallo-hydrolase [Labilibaculum sp. DW002]